VHSVIADANPLNRTVHSDLLILHYGTDYLILDDVSWLVGMMLLYLRTIIPTSNTVLLYIEVQNKSTKLTQLVRFYQKQNMYGPFIHSLHSYSECIVVCMLVYSRRCTIST
jgi:hypothetical protein